MVERGPEKAGVGGSIPSLGIAAKYINSGSWHRLSINGWHPCGYRSFHGNDFEIKPLRSLSLPDVGGNERNGMF
jgi:hypothetical protein